MGSCWTGVEKDIRRDGKGEMKKMQERDNKGKKERDGLKQNKEEEKKKS